MPRQARRKSETGIYHVMQHGINNELLFHEDADREAYLHSLAQLKAQHTFTLYAYCLMDNHIHLLVREGDTSLSLLMKILTQGHTFFFNEKYSRRGRLFQSRFKSEAIEDDGYLLVVLRYIHRNPTEIGRDITCWTSYQDYLEVSSIVDTDFILSMFDTDVVKARKQFGEFHVC